MFGRRVRLYLLSSRDETVSRMWPDGARSITQVTKRPVTAGMDFKNSIIALVEKNLSMKVTTLLAAVAAAVAAVTPLKTFVKR